VLLIEAQEETSVYVPAVVLVAEAKMLDREILPAEGAPIPEVSLLFRRKTDPNEELVAIVYVTATRHCFVGIVVALSLVCSIPTDPRANPLP
jgi:hypothetical protein